ncbi:fructose-1,6-bisphosphatase II [Methylacidiphilum kamchatkense Kam1]|uniref:Fructose-1,6-bisphosphatase n=2 Tax=Methylacidiphilum kamchatkense Kam1 TaxID=1202785 RepID=A0A516TMY9_9BACT|nr:fructose-1,6-bisphosphatase II [Methylacidiphilum kamchatkense Kam1]
MKTMERYQVENYPDIERIIQFDFVRATEGAALTVYRWLGRGEKEKADAAASDAIRGMFDLMDIRGEVVIGEGIKDKAPGIFKGEKLGRWTENAPLYDIAVDPIDGTTNVAKGSGSSLSVIAAASPEPGVECALLDIPCFYVMKLAYGPQVKNYIRSLGVDCLKLTSPVDELLPIIARGLRKRLTDLVVCVLDRPRHERLIKEIRSMGCALRLISDGDVTAAMLPSLPSGGIDVYIGIGGAPEAVLAAAAIKCLGGEIQIMVWPKDETERQFLIEQGWEDRLNQIFYTDDLAKGGNIIFCATAITDCPGIPGVRFTDKYAITTSLLMRAKNRTIRKIETYHNLNYKTIRLRSEMGEKLVSTPKFNDVL